MHVKQPSFAGLIGVAREDITPPVGIYARSWGAAKHDVAEGVHRPLTLTCLTFQSTAADAPMVLIAADLGTWRSREDEWLVRGGVIEGLGLEEFGVMLCLSHTHAGPNTGRDNAAKPGGHLIAPYLDHLRTAAITAANRALTSAAPAVLTWRYGRCDLATNRDLPDPAVDRVLCGFNPANAADDTLLVGRVTDNAGKVIATLVNYACHPTTLAWENRLISPDYVGAMRDVVEAHTAAAPCLFLQGASGELAPAEQYTGDVSLPDRHGRRLGYAVLSTLEAMNSPRAALRFEGVVESGAPLAVWRGFADEPSHKLAAMKLDIDLPLKDLPSIAAIEAESSTCTDPVIKERLWRKRLVRRIVSDGTTSRWPLWLWRLGDACLLGQSNEAYSIFQQHLRRRLPNRAVAVMNIVNGWAGYLPPREMYGQDLYQVWQTPFAAGSLELLTESAARAAGSIMKD